MMYGSLSTEQGATVPLIKTNRPRRRFKGAAHAVGAASHLEKGPRQKKKKQDPAGVFSNIFPKEEKQQTLTTSRRPHSFLYTMLNPKSRQWQAVMFKNFLSIVIVCDMLVFILSTEPGLKQYRHFFYIAEGVTSSIFLVEYIARLATITECHKYSGHPITGRLRYMVTPSALIDAFATFPFFIELIAGVGLPRLTYLRFFRLLRILRTSSFSKAADTCWRVIYYNREILQVAFVLCIYLIFFTAVALYYFRPKPGSKHKGDEFSSIGATMYMSTLLLTGQGGPEGEDLPIYTKAIVLMTGVFSIGMFAIPASMLTWGFEAEAQRVAAKARRRFKHAAPTYSSTSSSSSGDGDSSSSVSTSDEEYLKIIAGDEDDDEELLQGKSVEEQAAMQELLDRFREADADDSGNLTKREFLQIAQGLLPTGPLLAQQQPSTGVASLPLMSRIEQLEKKVDSTNARLDRILLLLEQQVGGQ